MGIPGFFKWLTSTHHYPDIVTSCVEYKPSYDQHGVYQPLDETKPNPNGIEFDNLYIDMNEIIHSSTKLNPKNDEELIKTIFDCIDRIFSIVRPRQLLYMAIDGVAPRAKLNHQRTRRFIESHDALDRAEKIEKIKSKIRANGGALPENQKERFDENCITPGTVFMSYLADCLRYFIYTRMSLNPAWRSIKVILSSSNVPGEGEHKIMNYIRQQADYDSDTHHVIYGSDADLIILGLATHQKYITIIRDEFNPNKQSFCDICEQLGHDMEECRGITEPKLEKHEETQYILVDLAVLRKHLYRTLEIRDKLPFQWDPDRAIDDWVFLCLLVGNDFLPNIPSFEVREDIIDSLKDIYIDNVPKVKAYLTHNGVLNKAFMKIIVTSIGEHEDRIFKNRPKMNQQEQNDSQSRSVSTKPFDINEIKSLCKNPMPMRFGPPRFSRPNPSASKLVEVNKQQNEIQTIDSSKTVSSNNQRNDRDYDKKKSETTSSTSTSNQQSEGHSKEEGNNSNDTVRLGEEGWHERYYKSKFKVDQGDSNKVPMQVVEQYTQGLCWILLYYYQGVPSWDWCYPYYYAPFASDFSNLKDEPSHFNANSKPLKPLEQLMSVFPPQCAKYLPDKWQSLVKDKDSPIIDFYPLHFSIDSNDRRFKSQYVALLSLVDEKRLHEVLQHRYSLLTFEENKRNEYENELLFIHSKSPYYTYLKDKLAANHDGDITQEKPLSIPSQVGIAGHIWPDNNDDKIIPIGKIVNTSISSFRNVINYHVICVKYRNE